jgi:hypothetical protein
MQVAHKVIATGVKVLVVHDIIDCTLLGITSSKIARLIHRFVLYEHMFYLQVNGQFAAIVV